MTEKYVQVRVPVWLIEEIRQMYAESCVLSDAALVRLAVVRFLDKLQEEKKMWREET